MKGVVGQDIPPLHPIEPVIGDSPLLTAREQFLGQLLQWRVVTTPLCVLEQRVAPLVLLSVKTALSLHVTETLAQYAIPLFQLRHGRVGLMVMMIVCLLLLL